MSDFTAVQLLNQLTPVIITGGYVPRGAYAAGTDYAVGDSVDYLGSSYVMFVDAAAGTLPTDTTKWQVIANKGDTGGTGTLEDLGGATKALDNLASVAINTSLISDADSTDDLGSTTKAWANLYVDTIKSITGNALALTPVSGQSLTVNLATTGDFVVNTNQLYVDTSTGNVGIGTTSPGEKLEVNGNIKLSNFTSGSLLFIDSSNRIAQDNSNLYWDVANSRFAFGPLPADTNEMNGTLNVSGPKGSPTGGGVSRNLWINDTNAYSVANAGGGINFGFFYNATQRTTGASIELRKSSTTLGNYGGNLAFSTRTNGGNNDIRMYINETGNVGIGTTGPESKLHVMDGSAGTVTANADAQLVVEDSGHTFIQILSGSTSQGGILFGDAAAVAQSQIFYDHNTNKLNITTDNTNTPALTIDSSRNVGIGTTTPTRIFGIGGLVAQNIGMERGTVADTAGFALTINAGSATSGATDKAGGDLILTPGLSTGTGESGVQIKGVPAGSTGTTDGTQTLMIQVLGNKFGVFAATPVVKQTGIAALKVDYTAGDLDTEAEIITALNTTNTAINALRTALNNYGFTTVV